MHIDPLPFTVYANRFDADYIAALSVDGDEDGWAYEVVTRPDGRFAIKVFDEDGFSLGCL